VSLWRVFAGFVNHRDTENTEVAQRKMRIGHRQKYERVDFAAQSHLQCTEL
jgi:hypothetical protein